MLRIFKVYGGANLMHGHQISRENNYAFISYEGSRKKLEKCNSKTAWLGQLSQ